MSENRRQVVRGLLERCADEVLEYVKQAEPLHKDRWVPAAEVKDTLDLNLVCVSQESADQGPSGWVFGALARMLEDRGALEYKRVGRRSFCRTVSSNAP